MSALTDHDARVTALTERRRSLIVEAGAGSGKTAIMAGRIALLFTEGVEPRRVAAITFTELAAAELAGRVRDFAEALLEDEVPIEVRPALPDGLDEPQRQRLRRAVQHLDELTATTIHGFAFELIRPYPAEADLDPGAGVLDAAEANLAFADAFDAWIRARLQGDANEGDVVVQLALQAGEGGIGQLRRLADVLRTHPGAHASPDGDPAARLTRAWSTFEEAVTALEAMIHEAGFAPEELRDRLGGLRTAMRAWGGPAQGVLRLAVRVLQPRDTSFCTQAGTFRAYRGLKGAWVQEAGARGRSKQDGQRFSGDCQPRYERVKEAFEDLEVVAVETVQAHALEAVREVVDRYQARKRAGALLDFDDLLNLSVRLLQERPDVRQALSERYAHVLVDEFQDTDPRQAEIVWRLTSEPRDQRPWRAWPARPGARFVVGDPKQSIYRFRHADVDTYLELRENMQADDGCDEVAITTNFRSTPGVIDVVNRTFHGPLSSDPQPGYQALTPDREYGAGPAVVRLAIPADDGTTEKVNASDARRFEARAVAAFCARLIEGDEALAPTPLDPSDIALLAPTSTELWQYEAALEALGVPVASQAGKGFYLRQEVQDLIALSRALADTGDTAALGAVLRGPLVGASEQRLLDVAETLYRRCEDGRLSLGTDPGDLPDPLVRRTLERLRPVALRARARTPYQTLAAALEQMEVRAILTDRHLGHAERALANLERFLDMSKAYAVRGLRAFADHLYAKWDDPDERQEEGRPDAQRDAVTLVTVHSAKGLEWPVVVPVNALGGMMSASTPFVDRATGRLWDTAFGGAPPGLDDAKAAEQEAVDQERVRLWYVALTRACDLLAIPEPRFELVEKEPWLHHVAIALDGTPEVACRKVQARSAPRPGDGAQGRPTFEAEAQRIAAATTRYAWRRPSRHDRIDEGAAAPVPLDDDVVPGVAGGMDAAAEASEPGAPAETATFEAVTAPGRVRGLVLHKLMEALIGGEATTEALPAHAATLLSELLGPESDDHAATTARPDPNELAATALRAWTLPEIAAVRERLVAELDVYGEDIASGDGAHVRVAGVADAVAVDEHGAPTLVVDWKSDVNPDEGTVDAYREQLRDYLALTGSSEGMIVFMTGGTLERVVREGVAGWDGD